MLILRHQTAVIRAQIPGAAASFCVCLFHVVPEGFVLSYSFAIHRPPLLLVGTIPACHLKRTGNDQTYARVISRALPAPLFRRMDSCDFRNSAPSAARRGILRDAGDCSSYATSR